MCMNVHAHAGVGLAVLSYLDGSYVCVDVDCVFCQGDTNRLRLVAPLLLCHVGSADLGGLTTHPGNVVSPFAFWT